MIEINFNLNNPEEFLLGIQHTEATRLDPDIDVVNAIGKAVIFGFLFFSIAILYDIKEV